MTSPAPSSKTSAIHFAERSISSGRLLAASVFGSRWAASIISDMCGIVPESRFARRKWRWFLPGQFDQQRDKFCLRQQRDSSQYDYYLVSFQNTPLIDTTHKGETDRREVAEPKSARCGIKCLKIHRTQLDTQRTCPGKGSVQQCRCNAFAAPFRQYVSKLEADSTATGYDKRRSGYTICNFKDTTASPCSSAIHGMVIRPVDPVENTRRQMSILTARLTGGVII